MPNMPKVRMLQKASYWSLFIAFFLVYSYDYDVYDYAYQHHYFHAVVGGLLLIFWWLYWLFGD